MKKKALITGICGQDGSYMAELLLNKNYEVHGITINYNENISHIVKDINLHYGDVSDSEMLFSIIDSVEPDEIYNFASVSTIYESIENPGYTESVNAKVPLTILYSISKSCPLCRFCQASSSEIFGHGGDMFLNEESEFNPGSPYALAKIKAFNYILNFKNGKDIYAVNSILFNHASPRGSEKFVTKKIIKQACEIKYGNREKILLGNLESRRDWGFAGDYVEAMWLMLQQEKPDDYIVATGEIHSVKDFCEETFKNLDIELSWNGENESKKAINISTGNIVIEVDKDIYNKNDIFEVRGDYSKAKKELNWSPKVSFKNMIKNMVEEEVENKR